MQEEINKTLNKTATFYEINKLKQIRNKIYQQLKTHLGSIPINT